MYLKNVSYIKIDEILYIQIILKSFFEFTKRKGVRKVHIYTSSKRQVGPEGFRADGPSGLALGG